MNEKSINKSRSKKKEKKLGGDQPSGCLRSVLEKASDIVSGDRRESYGSPEESFQRVSEGCRAVWGISVSATDIVKILITLKQVRESYQHKEDNLIDWSGYTLILDDLIKHEVIKWFKSRSF